MAGKRSRNGRWWPEGDCEETPKGKRPRSKHLHQQKVLHSVHVSAICGKLYLKNCVLCKVRACMRTSLGVGVKIVCVDVDVGDMCINVCVCVYMCVYIYQCILYRNACMGAHRYT